MQRRSGTLAAAVVFIVAVVALARFTTGAASEWNPAAFADEETLELRTTGPEEGEYWFPVWLAVLDDQVYVRLGSRAAERVESNTTAPYVAVKVGGKQFDRVRLEPVPDAAERVSAAMADKYWSDVFIRWFPHPMTLRLVAEG